MSDFYDIADHRPHLTVIAEDGVHVIPQAVIQQVINGSTSSAALTEPVIRRIIEEWLSGILQ